MGLNTLVLNRRFDEYDMPLSHIARTEGEFASEARYSTLVNHARAFVGRRLEPERTGKRLETSLKAMSQCRSTPLASICILVYGMWYFLDPPSSCNPCAGC